MEINCPITIILACEDWHIRVWEIPEDGIEKTQTDPLQILQGKIIFRPLILFIFRNVVSYTSLTQELFRSLSSVT